ncbi:peptidylprolyl isomerase [Sulfurimonas sp.]|uniref:peptidylprolyl isomerase n=1 Tax=Sulfurimonas sp. TaxID=2022749 RepID=UPI0035667232
MRVLFLLFLATILLSKDVYLPENTVAIVNGIAISEDELNREVTKLIPRSYVHTTVDEKKRNSLKEKALDTLIKKTLMYDHAIKSNITASDEEIKSQLSVIVNRYSSAELFNKALIESNFTVDTLKSSIKKDVILNKLYKKEIEFILSDEELKNNYEKNKHKFLEPEKIRVSLIYIKNDPQDPKGKEKAIKKAKEAEKMLADGENFEYVAQTYSDDPTRVMGGDLGFIHRGRLHPSIEDIAFSLDINKVSNVIVNDIGYFIVKVKEKKKQNQLAFETVKDSLGKKLKNKEEDLRKDKLLKRLMLKAVIIK